MSKFTWQRKMDAKTNKNVYSTQSTPLKRMYSILMNPPRYHVKIVINLEAVTCPGVWLCSHGFLEITIKVLGNFYRTGAIEPSFPLLCHDQFKLEGYHKNIQTMASLLDSFSKEPLEITLWQNSRRMAYYEGVLMDLLQYKEPKLQCRHVNTRQLLMKTTSAFPGIIAPKLELTSHLIIKDTVSNSYNCSEDLKKCVRKPRNMFKLSKNAKSIQYQKPCMAPQASRMEYIRKQKAVCHARNTEEIIKTPSTKTFYAKQRKRRDSIASTSYSNNTHTSVGICDLEHDNHQQTNYHTDEEFCELCQLYKEVFLK